MNNMKQQPTILALDTATEACSVGLLHQGQSRVIETIAQREHTKHILPMVDQILTEAGIKLADVDALAFGRGPGSFTGVRIGAGIAQGLALGANLPVIPVSNLLAMAQAAYRKLGATNVLAAIDARMNEVYFCAVSAQNNEKVRLEFQKFLDWQYIEPEQVCSLQKLLENTPRLVKDSPVLVGTGWRAYPELVQFGNPSEIILPSALDMLDLALPKYLKGEIISALDIEPIYLRNEVTWKKLSER